jgi:hypothetical protein
MTTKPPEDERESAATERRQRWTLYLAILALAVAVGHVAYAFIRDHVVD